MKNNEPLTAEIISIGDEMTSGARVDTNGAWLSKRLGDLGIVVRYHSTVGDSLRDNIRVFGDAASRVDIVISTGGLGPTEDDLTRQAVADVSRKTLVLHEESLRHIESLFSRRKRDMPDSNRRQAMIPEGGRDIFNPMGTAPGVDVEIPRRGGRMPARIFALPGVPAEMKQMFDETVAPRLRNELGAGRTHVLNHVVKCFGLGESEMEQRLGGMIHRDRSPRVGITASSATISLRITAIGEDRDALGEQITSTVAEIRDRVGEFVFGEGDDYELQDAVIDALEKESQSVCVLELGHDSLVDAWLSQRERPEVFAGGMTLPDISAMHKIQSQTGRSLTQTLKEWTNSDWVLIVSQYPALRDQQEATAAVETTFTVIDPDGHPHLQTKALGGHPSIVRPRIAKAALAFLLACIRSSS